MELILQIMSKVPTIFYFDGELLVDDEGKPRYVGGRRKGSTIKNHCSFEELKQRAFEVTKANPVIYDLKLAVKWVRDDGASAIDLEDDDDLNFPFSVGIRVIEIYVVRVEHENVVETQAAVISGDEYMHTTQLQETQCSAYPSYFSSHQGGEFTNLLQRYSGVVGVSSSQEQHMMQNAINPNQSQAFEK